MRILTDNFHSLFSDFLPKPDIQFYPKGFLPLLPYGEGKKVIIVHDVILQHYADKYPEERSKMNYLYWINQLKLSIKNADLVLTVSHTSKKGIESFCMRHNIAIPDIKIIFESSDIENIKIVDCKKVVKQDYVLHLASKAPHKKTSLLLKWWKELQKNGSKLPELKLVGEVSDHDKSIIRELSHVDFSSRMNRSDLIDAIKKAQALILPSEIEGFGLPAIEAFYLGTPVCYVANTSVDEIINGYHIQGKFQLDSIDSFKKSLFDTMGMDKKDALQIGERLRNKYATKNIVQNVQEAFEKVLEPKGKFITV